VEAVEGSGGRMQVVGRDRDRAVAELERLAPAGEASETAARERAANLHIDSPGAGEQIAAALAGVAVAA
jgi:hypothetical protein